MGRQRMVDSPEFPCGNASATSSRCSVNSSASVAASDNIKSRRRTPTLYQIHSTPSSSPVTFVKLSEVMAPKAPPKSVTVTSADHRTSVVPAGASSSSTVAVADPAVEATRCPGPVSMRAVTTLSVSSAPSAAVGTLSCASGAPAANSTRLGTAAPSIIPLSATVTGTVSASTALPVRSSVKTASSPSLA